MIIDTNDPEAKAFGAGFLVGFVLGVCFMLMCIAFFF